MARERRLRRPRWRPERLGEPDGGAAIVEFALMSVLLVFLLFAVLQVAVFFYARNVIGAAAADGARYAANAGVDPRAGVPRAGRLIADGLNGGVARQMSCTSASDVDATTGLPTVTVRCRGRMRLLLVPLRMPVTIDVQSSVLKEGPP